MTYNELWRSLRHIYDDAEAKAVVCHALDRMFGMTKADAYCGRLDTLAADERERLDGVMEALRRAVPVQYALGCADFMGRTFHVAPGVLVPRPETEELCQWVVCAESGARDILDIGTGSGCIAITLAAELGARVEAWDISERALAIASGNAASLGIAAGFVLQDALSPPDDSEKWDVVVSNPPYICEREKAAMERNVLEHEPHTALFVPDDDPLLFYRSIARYAARALKPGGTLYFEINPAYGDELAEMLGGLGFTGAELRRDQFGKERFVRASAGHTAKQH